MSFCCGSLSCLFGRIRYTETEGTFSHSLTILSFVMPTLTLALTLTLTLTLILTLTLTLTLTLSLTLTLTFLTLILDLTVMLTLLLQYHSAVRIFLGGVCVTCLSL